MNAQNGKAKLRSYHGNYAAYYKNAKGEEVCYFNPFYKRSEHLPSSFEYMFRDLAQQTFEANSSFEARSSMIKHLKELADLMVDEFDTTVSPPVSLEELDAEIPAGYTYFGQFIDHDISAGTDRSHEFEITKEVFKPVPPQQVVEDIVNQRTANFDLDSVYGGPGNDAYLKFEHFYEDGIKFKIGFNEAAPGQLPDPQLETDPNNPQRDLPRISLLEDDTRAENFPGDPITTALIGDKRNDENLIIAQFHLAFLKFHNKLVDHLRATQLYAEDAQIFQIAREEMTLHYQWLVVNDFLRRITDEEILDKIIDSDRTIYDELPIDKGAEKIYMPLEFATAAYRFGHSMVRNQYDFNLNFGRASNGTAPLLPRATFNLLFSFTGRGAELAKINMANGQPALPSFRDTLSLNWIVQWERFFGEVQESDQFTRKIDTKLAEFITEDGMQNEDFELLGDEAQDNVEVSKDTFNRIMKHLARRNLLRGFLLNMPDAQLIIDKINELEIADIEITALSSDELQRDNSPTLNALLQTSGFLHKTPLWFYILKEAEIQGGGNRLGQLGSWMVAQTIVGIIKESHLSFLKMNWNPAHSQFDELKGMSEVMDFLRFAGVALPSTPSI